MEWLRAQVRAGRIPALGDPSPALLAVDGLRLALAELDTGAGARCARLTRPVVRHLARGEQVGIGDGAVVVGLVGASGPAPTVTFGNVIFRSSRQEHALVPVLGPITVRIAPARGHRAELC